MQRCSGHNARAPSRTTSRQTDAAVVEVTKEGPCRVSASFDREYAAVHVRDFWQEVSAPGLSVRAFCFTLLLQGGLSRSLKQAGASLPRPCARNMGDDHNIDAPAGRTGPTGPLRMARSWAPREREEDSELWTHAELTSMIEAKVRSACPHPLRLADCGIAATHGTLVHDQRNMLIGFRCVDLQQHATTKASQP